MNVAVIVATYGDRDHWGKLAARALESVAAQTRPAEITIHLHIEDVADATALCHARNLGAGKAFEQIPPGGPPVDWLIFLDADDTLDPGYIEALERGADARPEVDVWQPATRGIHQDGKVEDPHMIPVADLRKRNFLVVGSPVRASMFFEVGGFAAYGALEDWALWIRCWKAGAVIGQLERAVYNVHLGGGRNVAGPEFNRAYKAIRRQELGR